LRQDSFVLPVTCQLCIFCHKTRSQCREGWHGHPQIIRGHTNRLQSEYNEMLIP